MLLPQPSSILWLVAGCIGVKAAVQADPNIKSIPVSLPSRICQDTPANASVLCSCERTAYPLSVTPSIAPAPPSAPKITGFQRNGY